MGIGLTAQQFRMNRLPGKGSAFRVNQQMQIILFSVSIRKFLFQVGTSNRMVTMVMMAIHMLHPIMVSRMDRLSQLVI